MSDLQQDIEWYQEGERDRDFLCHLADGCIARMAELERGATDLLSADAFYVYVAAPMSGYPGEYLANCARMSAVSRQLMDLGMCPINPAGDLLEGLASPTPLTDEAFKRRSMDLLRLLTLQPAALFVVATLHRNGSISGGVAAEIAEAEKLGIPVVRSLGELLALRAE